MANKRAPRDRIGLYSPTMNVKQADGRTYEGHLINVTVRELTQHMDGPDKVSVTARLLIHSTAILVFRIRAALSKYVANEDTESLDRTFVSLQNALRLNLATLGFETPAAVPMNLHEYIALKKADAA